MVMKPSGVVELAHLNFQSFLRQRDNVTQLDLWRRGRQQDTEDRDGKATLGKPYQPQGRGTEFNDLERRSPTPWAGLVVKSLAQTTYLDGVRIPGRKADEALGCWSIWQENRMDAKQIALHTATIAHGLAFGLALPGKSRFGGGDTAIMRPVSAKRMAAFYDSDDDEWPIFAIEAEPIVGRLGDDAGWHIRLYDDDATHFLSVKGDGHAVDDWTYISYDEHPAGVTPVVRYVNSLDLDGRAVGEIEPYVPLFGRIDQGTFDRLVVQRFGAWKVRYIAGLAAPQTDDEKRAYAMRLRVEDLLISPHENTKFGTLDATDIAGFINGGDADLRILAAISQTPPHHLLGLSSNLQAESLAAAESGLQRKSGDFKILNGESHEQYLRLSAHIAGIPEEARAFNMEARWRDTESRSLVQAANALGIIANSLHVPVEMLWERLPGWTDGDSTRAKTLIEDGSFEKLLAALEIDPNAGAQAGGSTGGSDNAPTA